MRSDEFDTAHLVDLDIEFKLNHYVGEESAGVVFVKVYIDFDDASGGGGVLSVGCGGWGGFVGLFPCRCVRILSWRCCGWRNRRRILELWSKPESLLELWLELELELEEVLLLL